MKLINDNGNINPNFALLLLIFGAVMVIAPLYFLWSFYVGVISFVLGMLLMGFAGVAAKSSALDLRAFTNDPLGWRKAKETYSQEVSEKSGDIP